MCANPDCPNADAEGNFPPLAPGDALSISGMNIPRVQVCSWVCVKDVATSQISMPEEFA